jgi:hypothetical protein
MKKAIIALSGILISAFVIVMIANGQDGKQDGKKATTEVSKSCSKCPAASATCKMKSASQETKMCDPAKCKEMGCDPAKCKDAKCSETCKPGCPAAASCQGKKCGMAKPQSGSGN